MTNEIRFIGDLQRLELKPGDMLVLTLSGEISREEEKHLTQALESQFPDRKVLVLTGGAKLCVVNKKAEH